ncbi:MAG: translation initiation factor IF-6 [Fervidicoccaceae archaeon]|jgi:translation initiation factor 6|uniref:Translation initiation factor 6 n=1 Tax=Fervidicoccus fontis TaxID=683846 RepID=A0A7C2UJU7_9CREN|nr:MAG: translation initiation factor IF-6 [Fervidicoccus sp.]HEU97506.1 translation initiation factor IF-6 [Fervidicoccus fontis]
MNISKLNIYRNPNIGVFLFANNKIALIPPNVSKATKKTIAETLQVDPIETTIAGMHIIGVLVTGNDSCILVPDIIKQEELDELKETIEGSMKVEVITTRHTALGNLISTNNKAAYISKSFEVTVEELITKGLGIPVYRRAYLGLPIIGSMIVANDRVAFVHPMIPEQELITISNELKVTPVHATVNEGVGFIKIGIVMNNSGILIGGSTTGPELVNITSALA